MNTRTSQMQLICTNIRTHIYILLCAGMVAAADSSSRLPACLLSHPCPPLLHAFLHTSSKMPSKIQARSCLAFGTVDINSCSILWSMRKRAGGVSLASARFCVRSLWCEKFVPASLSPASVFVLQRSARTSVLFHTFQSKLRALGSAGGEDDEKKMLELDSLRRGGGRASRGRWEIKRSSERSGEPRPRTIGMRDPIDSKTGGNRWDRAGSHSLGGDRARRGRFRDARMIEERKASASPFILQLQAARDLKSALGVHHLQQEKEAKLTTFQDTGASIRGRADAPSSSTRRVSRASSTFEALADIAKSSAHAGTCEASDVHELLARARACQARLRRPFFFSLVKTAAILISRSLATRELINSILTEMKTNHSIPPDQATISALVDLICSLSEQGRAHAADVWWILDQTPTSTSPDQTFATLPTRSFAPRIWIPLMKILATAAKSGRASSSDAMRLVGAAEHFFRERGALPSVFLFNSALLVLVNEQRFRTGGVSPGMRITARAASSSVTPHSTSSYATLVTTTTHTTSASSTAPPHPIRATPLPATAYYSQPSASPPSPPATRLESESRDQAAGARIATEWSPWEVLAVMDAMGEAADVVTLNTALAFYVPSAVGEARALARQQAVKLVWHMQARYRLVPDLNTYNAALQILAYSALDGAPPDDAIANLFSSSSSSRELQTAASSAALAHQGAEERQDGRQDGRQEAQDHARRAAAALAQVDEMMIRMRKAQMPPDAATYATLWNVALAACKLSVVVKGEDVERWLDDMQTEVGMGARGCQKILQPVTLLLPLVASAGLVSAAQARTIMAKLEALGSVASVQSYNLLLTTIARACRNGAASLADAGEVLGAMEEAKMAHNVYTFNALFDVLAAAAEARALGWGARQVSINDVEEMTERMKDVGVQADTVTLNTALTVLVALARSTPPRASSQDAMRLLQVFEDGFGVAVDGISLTKLLQVVAADAGHGRAELADADRILAAMRRRRILPCRTAWNVVMTLVARSAPLETAAIAHADRVLEQMKAEGFAADGLTIASYCNCARLAKIQGEEGEGLRGAGASSLRGAGASRSQRLDQIDVRSRGGGGGGGGGLSREQYVEEREEYENYEGYTYVETPTAKASKYASDSWRGVREWHDQDDWCLLLHLLYSYQSTCFTGSKVLAAAAQVWTRRGGGTLFRRGEGGGYEDSPRYLSYHSSRSGSESGSGGQEDDDDAREQEEEDREREGQGERDEDDFSAYARENLHADSKLKAVRGRGLPPPPHLRAPTNSLASTAATSSKMNGETSALTTNAASRRQSSRQPTGGRAGNEEEEVGWGGGASKAGEDEGLRGWSAGDLKVIRQLQFFDYTYVPEEDRELKLPGELEGDEALRGDLEAEADKLVARWRPPASRNATVPESKQRETYVLKAWRLFRGLPEPERSSEAYAAMMDAFGCIGRTAEARGLLDLAASHGLTPDTPMFNAALRCCRDQEEVKNVEQLMAAAGVKGNRATKRFLERALTRQEADYDFFRFRSSNERRDGFSRGGAGR